MNTPVGFRLLVLSLALTACGDNIYPNAEPIAPSASLTIVAHQDDDLLFMQPDLYDAIHSGAGVTNVYVTAGDAGHGVEYAEKRYEGTLRAYGAIAHDDNWNCGWMRIGTLSVLHCRLDREQVSAVFLGYPDGGVPGDAPGSLLHLSEDEVHVVHGVAERHGSITDERNLIRALTDIINETSPTTVRTLEIAATHGHDHADHMLVGALTTLAVARSTHTPELLAYRGYNTAYEPANADPALYAREANALAHYEACAAKCGPCGSACPLDKIEQLHRDYLARRYAVAMRPTADGQLQLGTSCLVGPETGAPTMGECDGAPIWHLDPTGALRTDDDLCLEIADDHTLVADTCHDAGLAGRFFLDDEGHLWSSIAPAPGEVSALAHLSCLVPGDGRPRLAICGADHAPTWRLVRPMTATPRATTTITRTGRAVRMGQLDRARRHMVCAVETGTRGLMCAPSDAGGALQPAIRVDSPAAPLAIDPDSLVLGDVDGDGLTDACGVDADGILCATAANSYQAQRWASALGTTSPASPTDHSLAIVPGGPNGPGGQICGVTQLGIACVAQGATSITDILSTWPDPTAPVWIADLDGDGEPDWCAATATGPACGLSADRRATTSGIPWSYAFGNIFEASASEGALLDTATAVVTDVDGDGRDDLCTVRNDMIACARSQGHGFGPRTPFARLPTGMVPTALWAERASTGGAARLCASDATTIACTALAR